MLNLPRALKERRGGLIRESPFSFLIPSLLANIRRLAFALLELIPHARLMTTGSSASSCCRKACGARASGPLAMWTPLSTPRGSSLIATKATGRCASWFWISTRAPSSPYRPPYRSLSPRSIWLRAHLIQHMQHKWFVRICPLPWDSCARILSRPLYPHRLLC